MKIDVLILYILDNGQAMAQFLFFRIVKDV